MTRHQPLSFWSILPVLLLLIVLGGWAIVRYATPTRERPADLTPTVVPVIVLEPTPRVFPTPRLTPTPEPTEGIVRPTSTPRPPTATPEPTATSTATTVPPTPDRPPIQKG